MPLTESVPGEVTIFEIRPSVFILFAELLGLVILIAGILYIFYVSGLANIVLYLIAGGVGIIVTSIMFLYWRSTIYRLTSKRVENRIGIFGSREEEISHDDIQAVDVQQSNIGKIFNFGTVMIKAAGLSREVDFTNIARPKMIADKIEDLAIEAGKRKRPVVTPP